MANIIPEKIPPKATQDEKRLFSILKKLPKDCSVFYEPVINNRQPDFVVVSPRIGIMVIEAKGWSLGCIDSVSHKTIKIRSRGKVSGRTHPSSQVMQYVLDIEDVLKNADKTGIISDTAGNLKFPIAFAVAMNNLSRKEVTANSELSEIFPVKNYLFKEEMNTLEEYLPNQIEALLKNRTYAL